MVLPGFEVGGFFFWIHTAHQSLFHPERSWNVFLFIFFFWGLIGQEAARESLVAKPGEVGHSCDSLFFVTLIAGSPQGRQTHEETAGLRLSERAGRTRVSFEQMLSKRIRFVHAVVSGRVANREKRLAEDEAAG